jgi:hypothetical protein
MGSASSELMFHRKLTVEAVEPCVATLNVERTTVSALWQQETARPRGGALVRVLRRRPARSHSPDKKVRTLFYNVYLLYGL